MCANAPGPGISPYSCSTAGDCEHESPPGAPQIAGECDRVLSSEASGRGLPSESSLALWESHFPWGW